jgi:hypothetical protein
MACVNRPVAKGRGVGKDWFETSIVFGIVAWQPSDNPPLLACFARIAGHCAQRDSTFSNQKMRVAWIPGRGLQLDVVLCAVGNT